MSKRRYGVEDIMHITGRRHGLITNTGKWRHGKNISHRVGDYFPYTIAERIVQKYIGKSFDDAFSRFCELVPKYQQREFLDLFTPRRWREPDYLIDSNGHIKAIEEKLRYKPTHTVSSPDYKGELVHKVTQHKKSDFIEVYSKKPYRYTWRKIVYEGFSNDKFLYYEYQGSKGKYGFLRKCSIQQRYKAQEKDFILKTISGWTLSFNSKNDPAYKKAKREANRLWKKKLKAEAIVKEQKLQEALKKREDQLKREKEENRVKIIKHGFDPLTSFRG